MNGGGAFGALVFVIGILAAFAVLFGFFLIVPFFVFLAGIIVMLVSDRKRGGADSGNGGTSESIEVETTTEVREVSR